MMNPREKAAVDKYDKHGYDIITNGVPDLILLKDGEISFVEVKSSEDTINENQERTISLLRKHGFKVDIRLYGYVTNELIVDKGKWNPRRRKVDG